MSSSVDTESAHGAVMHHNLITRRPMPAVHRTLISARCARYASHPISRASWQVRQTIPGKRRLAPRGNHQLLLFALAAWRPAPQALSRRLFSWRCCDWRRSGQRRRLHIRLDIAGEGARWRRAPPAAAAKHVGVLPALWRRGHDCDARPRRWRLAPRRRAVLGPLRRRCALVRRRVPHARAANEPATHMDFLGRTWCA